MTDSLVLRTSKTIKHFRIINKLSQEKLAEKAGLDRTYISGIERARRNITLDSLDKIITALEVDKKAFFEYVLQEAVDDISDK
ncbi:helix-turn-helix domain-containing protein [Pseudomonas sp. Leaf129]|uniref:helix-turn-helix domain-containing protein n=1 Tax=Pseudomonas sp. Leaf129 TaxID=1736268 RepID=UPI0009E8EFB4|nr:helix-turn-helix transcriptional regulator [Pseudomonas sp. Leaf129]